LGKRKMMESPMAYRMGHPRDFPKEYWKERHLGKRKRMEIPMAYRKEHPKESPRDYSRDYLMAYRKERPKDKRKRTDYRTEQMKDRS
jgi:hypothetical protein